jgi:AcrR family transcriptional regulator
MSEEQPQARDAKRTTDAILSAAQDAFSTSGYSGAGIREITAKAGVSPALVNRYFGTKERLFEAALAGLLNARRLLDIPRGEFGEQVVDLLLSKEHEKPLPLAMIMLATSDPTARAIADRLLVDLVLDPLSLWLGPVDGRVRAARFMIVSAGLAVYSQIYPIDLLTSDPDPAIREWLVDQFQRLAD